MRDNAGKTLYYEGTAEEITGRKLAEQEFNPAGSQPAEKGRPRSSCRDQVERRLENNPDGCADHLGISRRRDKVL